MMSKTQCTWHLCWSIALYSGVPETSEVKEANVRSYNEERTQSPWKGSNQPRSTAFGEPASWTQRHVGHHQWQVCGEVGWTADGSSSNSTNSKDLGNLPNICFPSPRQHKLEEALLFSGRFTDALQALNDWLYRAEPQLAEDVPVGGDKDMVHNLIDKHKVIRLQLHRAPFEV